MAKHRILRTNLLKRIRKNISLIIIIIGKEKMFNLNPKKLIHFQIVIPKLHITRTFLIMDQKNQK